MIKITIELSPIISYKNAMVADIYINDNFVFKSRYDGNPRPFDINYTIGAAFCEKNYYKMEN